jgi:hypothetical protein
MVFLDKIRAIHIAKIRDIYLDFDLKANFFVNPPLSVTDDIMIYASENEKYREENSGE